VKSLFLILCLAAIPAFGKLGPSFEVPVAPPVIARAAGTQGLPHVATDGRDFFAVWIDTRGGNGLVYGTRILADGTVLDPTGILIATSGGCCDGSPGLVWDGANYVVVWSEAYADPYYSPFVSFVRVDRNGTVLGTPKTLLPDTLYTGSPSIASNGHGSIVIFSKPVGTVVLISQDGSITRKNSFPQMVGRTVQIASNGDGYLLSWTDLQTTLLRLDNNGDIVAGSRQELNERGPYTQLVARIGGPYLLVGRKWDGEDNSCSRSIVGRMVTGSGVSDPFVIHDAGGFDVGDIAVTAGLNGFEVVWMKRLGNNQCSPLSPPEPPEQSKPYPPFGLTQTHLGMDGTSGAPVTLTEGSGWDEEPAVARNGAEELLVWKESAYTGRPSKLAAAVVQPGAPLARIPIASSAARQVYSGLAAAESTFMTVWSEENPADERNSLYARRFSGDGRALDASAITVSTKDQTSDYPEPAVSFDGAVWLFLWYAPGQTVARRMAADGAWIDAAPLPIGGQFGGASSHAVASNGNGFAVLTLGAGVAVRMTFIPRTGDMHDVTVAAYSSPAGYLRRPSMAWDGKAYVAVWVAGYDDNIDGIRLDQDGQIITPLFGIVRNSRYNDMPSIACHEGACAVAWQSDDSIAAARVIGGTVIPFNRMIDSSVPNTYAAQPTVLATHDGFQLFWTERGNAIPSLFTASITSAGIDSPNLLGAAGFYGAASAVLTTRGQLALTIVHSASDAAYGGAVRAFLRVWPLERRRAVGR
jgi:hypothetical protein